MKEARAAVIRLSPSLALRIRLLSISPSSPPILSPFHNSNHGCHESQSANQSPFITHETPCAEIVAEGVGLFGQFEPAYHHKSLCDLK